MQIFYGTGSQCPYLSHWSRVNCNLSFAVHRVSTASMQLCRSGRKANRQYVSKPSWLCSIKTLLTKISGGPLSCLLTPILIINFRSSLFYYAFSPTICYWGWENSLAFEVIFCRKYTQSFFQEMRCISNCTAKIWGCVPIFAATWLQKLPQSLLPHLQLPLPTLPPSSISGPIH